MEDIDQTEHLAKLFMGEKKAAPLDDPVTRIKVKYAKFFERYHYQLSHYFRHLYYLLKFIDENEQSDLKIAPEKRQEIIETYQFYAGVVQAQMSSAELTLLFYDGICFPKLNTYIAKYRLIQNLCLEDLADEEHHKDLYSPITLKSRYKLIYAQTNQ